MPISSKYLEPKYIEKVKRRILNKIQIDENSCWIWQGAKQGTWDKDPRRKPYGFIRFGEAIRLAHRVSKALFHGFHAIFDDRTIICCHTCDEPLCVNPDHIFLGTHYDNMADKQAKGRGKKFRINCPHCNKDI